MHQVYVKTKYLVAKGNEGLFRETRFHNQSHNSNMLLHVRGWQVWLLQFVYDLPTVRIPAYWSNVIWFQPGVKYETSIKAMFVSSKSSYFLTHMICNV